MVIIRNKHNKLSHNAKVLCEQILNFVFFFISSVGTGFPDSRTCLLHQKVGRKNFTFFKLFISGIFQNTSKATNA